MSSITIVILKHLIFNNIQQKISDPDAREMAEKAVAILEKISKATAKPETTIKDCLDKHGT